MVPQRQTGPGGDQHSVSGSMALGGGASLVAGTNYTEDAYLGMSFAF